MASPAAILQILVTANTAQATTALTKTQKQLGATASASQKMSSAVTAAGKAAAVATAGIGVASVKLATDFEKSMRNVNSIAQLPERSLKNLEKRVLSLAGKTAQAPRTLADGLYDLVSSGFDADESMKILASSAKAATAGLTTTEVSTKAVAAVLNAYQMPATKAAHVSDVLFRTVDRGVVSFEDLSTTIGDVLPFAASLGVRLEEVGAATATMTKAGISPAETMTRLKAVMTALIKPSEALERTLRQQGFESGEALIKAKGLQGALTLLAQTTGGSKAQLAKLFPDVRGLGGALALTGRNAKQAGEDLKGMGEAGGATNRALSQQSKSLSHAWQQLSAQVQALLIRVGQQLIPVLAKLARFFAKNETALVVLATAIAAGGAAWVAYKAHALAAAAATTVATGGLNLIIPLLAALGVALVVAYKKSEKFRNIVNGAFNAIKSVAQDVFGYLKLAAQDFAKPFIAAFRGVRTMVRSVVTALEDLVEIAKDAVEWVGNIKVPDITPWEGLSPFGGKGGGKVGPGNVGLMNSVQSIADASVGWGLSGGRGPGQAFRPGDDGWHGQNRARDLSGPPAAMLAFANMLYRTMGPRLLELIYTPMGVGIKNGKPVNIKSFYGADVAADHFDHVHVAMRHGGNVPGSGSGDRVPALLEPGEFVVNRKATAAALPFLQRLNSGIPRFQSGGLVHLAKLVKAVGLKGSLAQTMVAIGMAESGGRRGIAGDGGASIGEWQIHMPSWGYSRSFLSNSMNNARAMRRVLKEQGLGAWSVYNNGAYRKFMAAAARALAGATGKVRRAAGGGRGAGKLRGKLGKGGVGSGVTSPAGQLAADFDLALALAEQTPDVADNINALSGLLNLDVAKAAGIQGKLGRKNLKPAKRLKLTQELADLQRSIGNYRSQIQEFRTSDDGQDTRLAEAQEEANRLQEEANELARAQKEALDALRAEVARQNSISESTLGIGLREAQRALADLISGQVVGHGLAPRSHLPGYGVDRRY